MRITLSLFLTALSFFSFSFSRAARAEDLKESLTRINKAALKALAGFNFDSLRNEFYALPSLKAPSCESIRRKWRMVGDVVKKGNGATFVDDEPLYPFLFSLDVSGDCQANKPTSYKKLKVGFTGRVVDVSEAHSRKRMPTPEEILKSKEHTLAKMTDKVEFSFERMEFRQDRAYRGQGGVSVCPSTDQELYSEDTYVRYDYSCGEFTSEEFRYLLCKAELDEKGIAPSWNRENKILFMLFTDGLDAKTDVKILDDES